MKIALRLSLALLTLILPALAQTPAPGTPLPKNPSALMELAWQQNGLHDATLKPWHIHATWQTLDDKGQPKDAGTWEEWWANEQEYEIIYSTAGFRQTWWATDRGDFITGDDEWPAWIFEEIEDIFTPQHPTQTKSFKEERRKIGGVELQCLVPRQHSGPLHSYCLGFTSPAIRVEINPPVDITYNALSVFQGQILPGDIRLFRLGLPETAIHLDSVEKLSQVTHALFTPPADAVPVAPRRLGFPDVVVGKMNNGENLPTAKDSMGRPINGIIGLDVVVGKDGTISRLEVIGATPGLNQQPFLDALSKRRYEPSLYRGQPIATRIQEVLTFQTN